MAEISKKLLVAMDLGRFKAYRLEESPNFSNPRLVLLEDRNTSVTERLSDQVTDQAGQFPKGSLSFAAISDMSNGERNTLEWEGRRRAVKILAKRIGELLAQENLEECYLAAGSEINQTVMDALDPRTRAKVKRNVSANLTGLNPSDMIDHFCATV